MNQHGFRGWDLVPLGEWDEPVPGDIANLGGDMGST